MYERERERGGQRWLKNLFESEFLISGVHKKKRKLKNCNIQWKLMFRLIGVKLLNNSAQHKRNRQQYNTTVSGGEKKNNTHRNHIVKVLKIGLISDRKERNINSSHDNASGTIKYQSEKHVNMKRQLERERRRETTTKAVFYRIKSLYTVSCLLLGNFVYICFFSVDRT